MERKALEAEERIRYSLTKEEALENAIEAVEMYMKAIKLASDAHDRQRLKVKCTEALSAAEEIKRVQEWMSSPVRGNEQSTRAPAGPVAQRPLSTREQLILLEGAKIHGYVFPRWVSDPEDASPPSSAEGDSATDTSRFRFSLAQQKVFGGWKRPRDALSRYRADSSNGPPLEPTMVATASIDLVQDITTDCSVVASLCALVARGHEGLQQILQRIIHPYSISDRNPLISTSGRYNLCLYFNGCFRKVVVDDLLPTSVSRRALHVVDRNNPGLLWPALLEKAYLKVRGGYDFPGSNSGTDLWVLTGWLPEQVFLHSDEIDPEALWRRILRSYKSQDVMVTLGTGRLSRAEEEGHGLAGEHDYAVLDLKEAENQRWLLIKNPWCDGTVWKTSSQFVALKTNDGQSLPESSTPADARSSRDLAAGTFWMNFDQAIQHFESLYLNWDPRLFRYQEDRHFSWHISTKTCPTCFVRNPQYSLQAARGGLCWILLSRHFQDEESSSPDGAYGAQELKRGQMGFISLYIFDTNGRKVYMSSGAVQRGPFVDSPQTLMIVDLAPGKKYTIVVAQQDLPARKHRFTISSYSHEPLNIGAATDDRNHCQTIAGCWTVQTAGGNTSSPSYPANPQFKLVVNRTTDLAITLETSQPELPVHFKLVRSGGHRVTTLTAKDILVGSGEYSRGAAFAEMPSLPVGVYTVICSTFDQGRTGEFDLRVDSTQALEISRIPSESAGLLSCRPPTLCLTEGVDRMLAPLRLRRLTRVKVVARHTLSGRLVRAPLKLSWERSQGPHKMVLATSGGGDFSDDAAGIRIGETDIDTQVANREGVWLVVERLGRPHLVEEIEVEILSDAPVELGPWGIGNG